ncbi:nucleotidyltransferase domain-containing protein [Alicyclobacillus fastidiosus]|uniref:Nucleotidyltransferase domain-containing protein n=1 Tax=Alicyclobacillus fastidiosus TaxID=392011 RepID=A0ABV5ANY3_9BACL
MAVIDPHIKDLIRNFLQYDAPQRNGHLETVILCGSHATGQATVTSDIDLCYIGTFPTFKRENIVFQGNDFELMVAPWSWYEQVVSERKWANNIGTPMVMLAQGRCVWGNSEKWVTLQKLVQDIYNAGPVQASNEDIRRIRFHLTNLWDDYCDKENQTERQLLAVYVIQTCIESLFVLRQWWAVKPKYQLVDLRSKDAYLSYKLEQCIQTLGADQEVLRDLCTYVLNPVGGWLRESWKTE